MAQRLLPLTAVAADGPSLVSFPLSVYGIMSDMYWPIFTDGSTQTRQTSVLLPLLICFLFVIQFQEVTVWA